LSIPDFISTGNSFIVFTVFSFNVLFVLCLLLTVACIVCYFVCAKLSADSQYLFFVTKSELIQMPVDGYAAAGVISL